MASRRVKIAAAAIVAVLALLVLLSVVVVYQMVYPAKQPITKTPADYGLPYQSFEVTAEDGIVIRGWFLPNPSSKDVIIVCHGYVQNKSFMLEGAKALYEAGYNVVLFDFRGQGESDYSPITFGYKEKYDVFAVVEYVLSKEELSGGDVGIYGHSMGGATAIIAAAQTPAIEAVVTDGAYSRLTDAKPAIPLAPVLTPMVFFFGGVMVGTSAWEIVPADYVGKISPRPILIIHGDADTLIPVEDAYELYQRAGKPKELWIIPGADHDTTGYLESSPQYWGKVVSFFKENL